MLIGLQPSNRSQIVAVSSRDHVRGLATIWSRFPISNPSIGGEIVSEVVDFVSKSTSLITRFDHFFNSFAMDGGTGGRESIPNCCQTSDMPPTFWAVQDTHPTLKFIPLPPP